MPLNPAGLKADIEAMTNPASKAAAAQDWADAMEAYASGVVPASTTVSAAAAALKPALETAFGSADPATTANALETAFLTFATSVATGMLPAWTGVPPPSPVGFLPLLSTNKSSLSVAAQDWSDAVQAWMVTGTATLVAPPNTPTNWS